MYLEDDDLQQNVDDDSISTLGGFDFNHDPEVTGESSTSHSGFQGAAKGHDWGHN
jgi:hypothetical protein